MRHFEGRRIVTASVTSPSILKGGRIFNAAQHVGDIDPSKYLLSHVTILVSIDADERPEFYVQNPYGSPKDWLVSPETIKNVNGNGDCWERRLMKKAAPTFRTANNYVEHWAVPSLAKGVVVDAVVRSTKEADYVDLLVATEKKHEELCRGIISGQINKLSMGCNVTLTVCSKCGKWMYDDWDVCPCIRDGQKLGRFYDVQGGERIISEQMGHRNVKDSCQFYDASWVEIPAYSGAVVRKVVEPDSKVAKKLLATAFERRKSAPASDMDGVLRVASQAADISYTLRFHKEGEEPPEEGKNKKKVKPFEEAGIYDGGTYLNDSLIGASLRKAGVPEDAVQVVADVVSRVARYGPKVLREFSTPTAMTLGMVTSSLGYGITASPELWVVSTVHGEKCVSEDKFLSMCEKDLGVLKEHQRQKAISIKNLLYPHMYV